jgi:cytochrome c-type biogenesis protein CcmH/NrfG
MTKHPSRPKDQSLSARQAIPSTQEGQGGQPAMVRKQTAVVLAVVMLLAGVFIGWQAAVIVVNQDGLQGGVPSDMPGVQQGAASRGMPGQDSQTPPLMDQAKAMEEKVAKNPNDPAVWAQLGDTYYDTGLSGRAVAAYQKSLALKPNQPDVWTDMGVMLRAEGKPKDARQAFEQAMSIDPKHEQSRLNLGVVMLYDLNDKAGALKAWQGLLAIDPEAKMPDGKSVADAVKELSGAAGK